MTEHHTDEAVTLLEGMTLEQRVRFNILCAQVVYQEPQWTEWADRWLDGTDRSEPAARRLTDICLETTPWTLRVWAAAGATLAAQGFVSLLGGEQWMHGKWVQEFDVPFEALAEEAMRDARKEV